MRAAARASICPPRSTPSSGKSDGSCTQTRAAWAGTRRAAAPARKRSRPITCRGRAAGLGRTRASYIPQAAPSAPRSTHVSLTSRSAQNHLLPKAPLVSSLTAGWLLISAPAGGPERENQSRRRAAGDRRAAGKGDGSVCAVRGRPDDCGGAGEVRVPAEEAVALAAAVPAFAVVRELHQPVLSPEARTGARGLRPGVGLEGRCPACVGARRL